MSPQIFISYSHKDTGFASKVTKNLENEGYDIWLDRMDIQTGSRWDDEVVRGLNASQIFMVLLSNTSVASQNVKDEISYAIDHNKSIVPLLLEHCEIPFRLRRVQYVDFTSRSFNEGLQIVLNILRSFQSETKHQKSSLSKEKDMDPTTLAASVTALVTPYLESIRKLGMRAHSPEDECASEVDES
jgi:hypothetical protein